VPARVVQPLEIHAPQSHYTRKFLAQSRSERLLVFFSLGPVGAVEHSRMAGPDGKIMHDLRKLNGIGGLGVFAVEHQQNHAANQRDPAQDRR
jgi:hypothetical protein